MKARKSLNEVRGRRAIRVRARVRGTAEKPRLAIFRSNRFTYAQLIDDEKGKTLVSSSTREASGAKRDPAKKSGVAHFLGKTIAERAKQKGVSQIVFDRRSYRYHGRVRAVAEGAREAGLTF